MGEVNASPVRNPCEPALRSETEAMVDLVRGVVASAFDVCPAAIRDRRRGAAREAFARQVAIYLSCTRLGMSYSAAGRLFGRDRTTATMPAGSSKNAARTRTSTR